MQKNNLLYLEHIKTCIEKIFSYTENLSEDDFLQNEMAQDAVIRNFEIIGEATKKLSSEFKFDNPDIPWKHIAGMRDVLIHDYIGVDIWIVWDTVLNFLPKLKGHIEQILKDNEQ